MNPTPYRKINKYRNIKVKFDGYTFDSKKEYFFYLKMKQDKADKKIKSFIVHPKHKFPCGLKFTADFSVLTNNGDVIIYEIKSPITKKETAYRMRMRMFKYHYPNINFVEV